MLRKKTKNINNDEYTLTVIETNEQWNKYNQLKNNIHLFNTFLSIDISTMEIIFLKKARISLTRIDPKPTIHEPGVYPTGLSCFWFWLQTMR